MRSALIGLTIAFSASTFAFSGQPKVIEFYLNFEKKTVEFDELVAERFPGNPIRISDAVEYKSGQRAFDCNSEYEVQSLGGAIVLEDNFKMAGAGATEALFSSEDLKEGEEKKDYCKLSFSRAIESTLHFVMSYKSKEDAVSMNLHMNAEDLKNNKVKVVIKPKGAKKSQDVFAKIIEKF